jgi:UDP-2-acetamido-2,6-beta-L-arabino-hexul-4-ose reductase
MGRNLVTRLRTRDDIKVLQSSRRTPERELNEKAAAADVVVHLAGVNRPDTLDEFERGNAGFTHHLTQLLRSEGRTPLIVFASSTQATQDNAYGRSKFAAEEVLRKYGEDSGARIAIFRLRNIFGKWSRPNYNSVVATFCYNIARGLPITISDPARELDLVYIDDVVEALVRVVDGDVPTGSDRIVHDRIPSARITLGELAARVRMVHRIRGTLVVPDFSDRFNRQLYATYLSYVDAENWEYGLERRSDERGDLAELIKSQWFGQIFVSRTRAGATRGNHYHHTKAEKFFVLSGRGLVRFRHVEREDMIEFVVRGEDYRVIDIPPGYAHSITNVGDGEMITLFWASEVFDPNDPDTNYIPVEIME